MALKLAIVGRPNVGKSTLFNRLAGKKLAIVDDQPGVTRDRREGDASLLGMDFRIIDTAGFEDEDAATLPGRMRMQTQAAVDSADVALFLASPRSAYVNAAEIAVDGGMTSMLMDMVPRPGFNKIA